MDELESIKSQPARRRGMQDCMIESGSMHEKHGVDDNPNVDDNPSDGWPYQPEIDAGMELMDLAEPPWRKSVLGW
jgi:hypothetical protein